MIKKADSFTVSNPEWTYGKKVVVLERDYEKLWEAFEQAQRLLAESRGRAIEWEKAARHARNMVGSIKVMK